MKYKEVFKGYSVVGLLNLVLFQWLFFRVVTQVRPLDREIIKVGIAYPVLPLSGIWTKYMPRKIYRTWVYKKAK